MRNVSLAVRVVAIVAVFSVSAVGQQPTVLIYPSTSIDLSVEPVRLQTQMTLADAATHNDFPLFNAMFDVAPARDASAYREFHSFWKWSLTDRVGAFYGDDFHAKFAAEYPDYANYIADFGIIDSHARAFYPSAETRTFLLRKAVSGRTAVVAEVKKPVVVVVKKFARQRRADSQSARPAESRPYVTHEKPVVIAKPMWVPAQAVTHTVAAKPVAVRVAPKTDARLGRGLLLMIAGLVALGMLSLVFSATGEEEAKEERAAPVEPLQVMSLDEKPKKTA